MKYASFIMTYRRPEILKNTIQILLDQSLPPTKILIVDNDPDKSAEGIATYFPEKNMAYHSVGYNSGPAGAAYWGMKLLFEEGWEWVLWMDDDDPPVIGDLFERLFLSVSSLPNLKDIGIMGGVGVRFNPKRAKIIRIPDSELKGLIDVDNVAGGQFPLVNRIVFEKGILPDKDLFFGFEELEFNLRLKRAGLKLCISGDVLKELRIYWSKLNVNPKLYHTKRIESLWREYYSTRNLIWILKSPSGSNRGIFLVFFKSIVKTILGFRLGLRYGLKNAIILHYGFWDGILNRRRNRFNPN
jgi:GT2 family glycosyltransferase